MGAIVGSGCYSERNARFGSGRFRLRRTVWMVLLCAVVLLAGAMTPGSAQEPVDGRSLQKVRLQLKWRHQFQFAGYYAAIENGFFRDEGLAVELIEGRPGFNPVDELVAGKVEFAIESPAVLIKRQQNMPVVVVAAIFQHSPASIITRRDSGLNTPQSLKGKRVMLTSDTDPESLAMLVEEGVPLHSVTILPHNWGLADLIDGRIDGQTAYLTNEPYLLKMEGVDTTVIRPLNYGIDFYGDCIITTEDEVRTHLERLEAFRRAVQLGWVYAMAHPLEISELIRSRYSQEKSLDQLMFEASAMRELIQPALIEVGHINPERWRHIADTFVKLGMMKADYTLRGFIYNELRDQIAAEKQHGLRVVLTVLGAGVLLSIVLGAGLMVFNRKLADQVRKRTASLARSEQHFRAFFEMASVGVAQVAIQTGRYQRINKKYCEIVGYNCDELQGLSFADITHPEDLDFVLDNVRQLIAGEISEFTIEKRYIRKDGRVVWVLLTVSPLWVAGQQPEYSLAVIRDITVRKLAEERLVFAAKVFENSIEGIVVTDSFGTIMQVNSAFSVITGYGAEEAIGKNPRILKSDKHSPAFYEEMWKELAVNGQWAGEIWNRNKKGEAYPEWLTISAVKNPQGKTTNYVAIFHDISESKRQQEALKHQAQHDALTGLPNRVLINDRLEMTLARMKRYEAKLALLYLDLDNFKHINDGFGHTTGDNLLIELSRRLAGLLRTGDTIGRLGGDEFLILLPEVEHIDAVSLVAMRLIESLKQPFRHGEIEFFVTASIGVTIAPDDGNDAVTLVKNADIAMYRAKSLGRNNYQFFAPELDIQAHRRASLEMKLRKGLERGEFELHYQPLVHITSGEILGAEALVRWRNEEELISPGEFIPLAEESGLILPLGEWVLNAAAYQAKKWQDAGHSIGMSVNISARQFGGQNLVEILRRILTETGLEQGRLYFEVTESVVMGDLANAQRIMGALRDLGTKFYLDDFGTGYSSLSYLKRLPIDGVKIDRSFIRDMVADSDSKAIAAVVVSLARVLGLAIVAEGVETEEQWKVLHNMGDMLIQGYLASRPVPAEQFELLLMRGKLDWNKD
jgi:diguanylate cyclase (GGDEF)-like protein/PAS domain S-box-containing protein